MCGTLKGERLSTWLLREAFPNVWRFCWSITPPTRWRSTSASGQLCMLLVRMDHWTFVYTFCLHVSCWSSHLLAINLRHRLFPHAAAEGQVDCLLLLVNREQSADIIDCQDAKGMWVIIYFIIWFDLFKHALWKDGRFTFQFWHYRNSGLYWNKITSFFQRCLNLQSNLSIFKCIVLKGGEFRLEVFAFWCDILPHFQVS